MLNDLFQEKKDNIQEDTKDNIIEKRGSMSTKHEPIIEEKLNKIANILNKLNKNDKQKLLNALEDNVKSGKNQEVLSKLRNKIRKTSQIKIIVNNMKIKKGESPEKDKDKEKENKEIRKPKLSEEKINEKAFRYSAHLYYKEKEEPIVN